MSGRRVRNCRFIIIIIIIIFIIIIIIISSTGRTITKNNRLTHLGEMPGVDGFSPTYSLHVKSCSDERHMFNLLSPASQKGGDPV